MIQVGANFKAGNAFPVCPLCKDEYDCQKHLIDFPELAEANAVCKETPKYDNLFRNDVTKMRAIVQILQSKFKKRQKLLLK